QRGAASPEGGYILVLDETASTSPAVIRADSAVARTQHAQVVNAAAIAGSADAVAADVRTREHQRTSHIRDASTDSARKVTSDAATGQGRDPSWPVKNAAAIQRGRVVNDDGVEQ